MSKLTFNALLETEQGGNHTRACLFLTHLAMPIQPSVIMEKPSWLCHAELQISPLTLSSMASALLLPEPITRYDSSPLMSMLHNLRPLEEIFFLCLYRVGDRNLNNLQEHCASRCSSTPKNAANCIRLYFWTWNNSDNIKFVEVRLPRWALELCFGRSTFSSMWWQLRR